MKLLIESSARLWKGHTAEGELGLVYDDIDLILDHIERRITISSYKLRKKAIKVKGLIEKNKHKHEMPVVCKLFLIKVESILWVLVAT